MLSPPDALVVERDPDVHGLARLLDPEAFAELIRHYTSTAEIESIEPNYVRYKPGTSCLVGYRAVVDGCVIDLYARAHRPAFASKVEGARSKPAASGPLGDGVIALPDAHAILYTFPNDHELPILRRLADRDLTRRLVKHVLPQHPQFWESQLTGIAYKPERRYVASLSSADGERAVLKFYDESHFALAGENASAFHSQETLRVPLRLRRSHRHRVVAYQWMDGERIDEILCDPARSSDAARQTGVSLAHVHAQNALLERTLTSETYLAAVAAATASAAHLLPEIAERLYAAAKDVAAILSDHEWITTPIHGDFSADQLLRSGNVITVLDTDAAAYGHPAIDLGSFVARLIYESLCHRANANNTQCVTEAFIAGYLQESGSDAVAIWRAFAAAALLRLVAEPFRYRETNWPAVAQSVVHEAEEFLNNVRSVH